MPRVFKGQSQQNPGLLVPAHGRRQHRTPGHGSGSLLASLSFTTMRIFPQNNSNLRNGHSLTACQDNPPFLLGFYKTSRAKGMLHHTDGRIQYSPHLPHRSVTSGAPKANPGTNSCSGPVNRTSEEHQLINPQKGAGTRSFPLHPRHQHTVLRMGHQREQNPNSTRT